MTIHDNADLEAAFEWGKQMCWQADAVLPADEVTTEGSALSGFGLLQAKAKANGHTLGVARVVEGHGGRGFMARCQAPSCGASIWERPDLMGGHGAGPLVRCVEMGR